MLRAAPRCRCLRWFFDAGAWEPRLQDWILAVQAIQLEELSRAKRYIYRTDCKATVVGRLMIRAAAASCLDIEWRRLVFSRDSRGKPYIDLTRMKDVSTSEADSVRRFSFNISHHGSLVILATCCGPQVGTDVMSVSARTIEHSAWPSYMDKMQSQFSEREFRTIHDVPDIPAQMQMFYRIWCLKESYIKALGVGIHQNLAELDFDVVKYPLFVSQVAVDTRLILGESEMENWIFEEQRINNDHCAAVAYRRDQLPTDCAVRELFDSMPELAEQPAQKDLDVLLNFRRLAFGDLIKKAQRLHCPLNAEYDDLMAKLPVRK